MDKSSFQKLFKEMYQVNPDRWNELLTKAGKTTFSAKGKKPYKINRQSMGSNAFRTLMNIDYSKFKDQGKKQQQEVIRPKSVRINGMTLPQIRNQNNRNANAETSFVDSSAVESFRYDPEKKNLDIKFVGGNKEYRYPDVPRSVANGLYAAPSKGAYVNSVVSRYSDISNPEVQKKIKEEG